MLVELDGSRARMLTRGLAGKVKHYVARIAEESGAGYAREEAGVLTIVNSGIVSDTFNCVVVHHDTAEDWPVAMARVCAEFETAALPVAWWTCDGLRPSILKNELAKYGVVYRRLGFFEVCTFRVYSSRHRFT